jgi:hypothetical protein
MFVKRGRSKAVGTTGTRAAADLRPTWADLPLGL